MSDLERTSWGDDGFACPPEEKRAVGGEIVYRAYGGSSNALGVFFFVPVIKGALVNYWTAEILEIELNASLWGNDFEKVAKFELLPKIQYQIGPIAHDNYVGNENGIFYQRSFVTPSGIFQQVKIDKDLAWPWENYIRLIDIYMINEGNYCRHMAKRSKRRNQ